MAKNTTDATLADLRADPNNAREHTPRNVGLISAALREVGAGRSVVIDEDGVVLAGNATIEAAAEAGIERVQIVDVDGETIVAVRRSGLTAEQKTRLALYDNRAGELSRWNVDVLASLNDSTDLSMLFSATELDRLLPSVSVESFRGALPSGSSLGDETHGQPELPRPANDPEEEWRGMPEFENPEVKPEYQVRINFTSLGDVRVFEQLIQQDIPESTRTVWFPKRPINRVEHLRYRAHDDE